jgi:hypothetical protein
MDNKKAENISESKKEQELYRRKNTIQDIEKSAWNQYMGKQNIFDWDGMVYLEKTFSQHPDPTNQWDFYYYNIKDNKGIIVLMTFVTYGLWKTTCWLLSRFPCIWKK